MATSRRQFLSSLAAGAAFGPALTRTSGLAAEPVEPGERTRRVPPAPRALDLLILGGTNLTGPHHVRYALERGHSVSIFTRGRTQPGLFEDAFEHVEHLLGDRENDLEALKGRRWDAVIDASGMNENWTRDSAELLRDSVDTYLYISSTGVYYPYLTTEIGEDTEVGTVDVSEGKNLAYRYGTMKARSEQEARNVFGDRTTVIRAGYIVGPLDGTHRGTYWPERLTRGGEVLVPGRKDDRVQQIDVRDLTEWIIRMLENGTHGVFNATGPATPITMEEFVYGVRAISTAEVRWTWIEDLDFLQEHRVYAAIPWVLPAGDNLGSQRIAVDRARAAGLTYRSIATTATETLEWYNSLSDEKRTTPPMLITPEREAELLATWKARAPA